MTSGFALDRRDDQTTNVGQRIVVVHLASLPNSEFTVTVSQSVKWAVTVSRLSGHATSSPVRAHVGTSGSSGNADPPNLTGIVSGDLVLGLVGNKKNDTWTPPSGYAERYDNPNSTDGLPSNSMADKTATGTSEDPGGFVPSSGAEWCAAAVAIAPAAGGAAVSLVPPRRDRSSRGLVMRMQRLRSGSLVPERWHDRIHAPAPAGC